MTKHDGRRRAPHGPRTPRRGPRAAAWIAVGALAVALGTAGQPVTSVGQVRLATASVPTPPAPDRALSARMSPADQSLNLRQLQRAHADRAAAAAVQANVQAANQDAVRSVIGNLR